MLGIVLSIVATAICILIPIVILAVKILVFLFSMLYMIISNGGKSFQDCSKLSHKAKESRKRERETYALAEMALERATWSEEYIRNNGEKQRAKDKRFLKRTLRAIKWQSVGLLMPQGLTQVFATRLPSLFSIDAENVINRNDEYNPLLDTCWRIGDEEMEGETCYSHPYRSSLKIAIITFLVMKTLVPGAGLFACISSGISLGITIPIVFRCAEILTSLRLKHLAKKTHRAIVITQYPCEEGRTITEREIKQLKLIIDSYRRYEEDLKFRKGKKNHENFNRTEGAITP